MSHDDVLMGENEAYKRLRSSLHQGNPNGIEYPTATNNRGHLGAGHGPESHGKKREHHAHGDRVGMKREEHGWGDAIGGAFKKAGSAMGKGVGSAARTVGGGMQKAGKAVANFAEGESIARSGKVPDSFTQPGQHMRKPHRGGGRCK